MKILILVFDISIMAGAISLAKNGYDASILITVVSIISYCCGYMEKDLE